MWEKKESKLELAASMVRRVMPEFTAKKNVIILCDSWYVKKNLASIVDEYENPDLIGNARSDYVIYDLPPQRTGKKGRSASHGKRLSIYDDFALSDKKIGDYYMAVRRVLTNIFGKKQVLAYVTSPEKTSGTRRLFFSTVYLEELQIFCVWQEKAPMCQTGSRRMQFIPLMLYAFRWKVMPISALCSSESCTETLGCTASIHSRSDSKGLFPAMHRISAAVLGTQCEKQPPGASFSGRGSDIRKNRPLAKYICNDTAHPGKIVPHFFAGKEIIFIYGKFFPVFCRPTAFSCTFWLKVINDRIAAGITDNVQCSIVLH